MSGVGQGYGEGFFYTPEDQAAQQAILRRQSYAKALMQGQRHEGQYGGLADAGNSIAGALIGRSADKQSQDLATKSQGKYSSDLANLLRGGGSGPSPQISNIGGAQPEIDAEGNSAAASGIPQKPAAPQLDPEGNPMPQGAAPPAVGQSPMGAALSGATPQGQPPSQAQPQNIMERIAASGNPALMYQFGAPALQAQMQNEMMRGNKVWENDLPESRAAREGRAGALQNQETLAGYTNKLPQTANEKATTGLGYAQLNKPEAVGFGATLVNPRTGQVVYQSAPDTASINQMVDWSLAHGGQIPPNARNPAIQQAFNSALGTRLKDMGITNDDLVNKNIAIGARRGAAVTTAKQQAGTQINEDTVSGGMNILNGLLKKGAAGPSSITGLNDLILWGRQHTSDPDAANLVNAIGTISNEYARVMTGTTGGSPSSDSARNESAQRLLKGYKAGTMQDVMGQMHYEMRQRSTAQHGALNQLTGGQYGGVGESIKYNDPNGPNVPIAKPTTSNW